MGILNAIKLTGIMDKIDTCHLSSVPEAGTFAVKTIGTHSTKTQFLLSLLTSTSMNVFAPVSTLMTDHHKLVTVSPEDTLETVKHIFDTNKFHHLPVVHFREIVGMISRTDFDHFMGGSILHKGDKSLLEPHLQNTKASDLMITRLGKIESTDRINVALEIFNLNRFHALPVVDDGELVGIITPFDILKALSEEKLADPSSVYDQPH